MASQAGTPLQLVEIKWRACPFGEELANFDGQFCPLGVVFRVGVWDEEGINRCQQGVYQAQNLENSH